MNQICFSGSQLWLMSRGFCCYSFCKAVTLGFLLL